MGLGSRRGRAILLVALLVASLLGCARPDAVEFESRALVVDDPGAPPATTAPAQVGGLLPAGREAGGAGGAATGGSGPVGTPGGGGGGPGAAGGAPIRLGTVLPLQGGQRDFGEPILRTTQAFIDELNSRGGINGAPVELIAYNACLLCQADALAAVRRLVEEDHVFALVNTYVMVVAFQTVLPYLIEQGVPLIQGASEAQTSDALSPVNFATAPPGAFYAKLLPAMVTEHIGVNRIGITYINVPAEANGIPILVDQFNAAGVEVVATEPVDAAEDAVTNMDAIVTRMRSRGAQAVVATNPVLVVYGRLAADRQGWGVQWAGPAAWSRLVEDGCGVTCDDLVLTDTAGLSWVGRDTPQMRQYIDTMQRRFPTGEITGHTLAAWVGMQLTTEVLQRTGPDRAAFLATMESLQNLDLGTTSPLTFGPDRHLGGSLTTLLRLSGGRYVAASEPLTYGEADL